MTRRAPPGPPAAASSTVNPLIRKLEHAVELTDGDRKMLNELLQKARTVEANVDIIAEGDRPSNVHLVLAGLAYRYKTLENGRRQILALLVPGDFCDLHVALLGEMDHAIATAVPSTIVYMPADLINQLTTQQPRITRGLWWATLVDEAILREWLVNMGQRPADKRVAHVFCELLVRLQAVGQASENAYSFPLSQNELSDILGLTEVHINRTLQSLRERNLITLRGFSLTIPDVGRLRAFAGFNPNYLHLKRHQV